MSDSFLMTSRSTSNGFVFRLYSLWYIRSALFYASSKFIADTNAACHCIFVSSIQFSFLVALIFFSFVICFGLGVLASFNCSTNPRHSFLLPSFVLVLFITSRKLHFYLTYSIAYMVFYFKRSLRFTVRDAFLKKVYIENFSLVMLY